MNKDLDVAVLLDFYGAMLTVRQRDMVSLYYCDDLSLAEIAENEGITRQAVSDLLRRAVQQLGDMERKLGFVATMRRVNTAAGRIRACAVSLDGDCAAEIISQCDVILGAE